MELVLSRGQERDWTHSSLINACGMISLLALSSFVVWEWHHKNPIVDVRMFKQANFATANLMMFFVAGLLYGTTVLFPLYVQGVMNYSAQQAGLVLSPGALAIAFLMPVAAAVMASIDARILIAFGFAVTALALFYMSSQLYPGIDLSTAIKLRCYQIIGVAFLFVPLNTLAYVGVAPDKRNAVSGIINFSRNVGGEVGISLVTTLIARRTHVHQAQLAEHVTPDSAGVRSLVHSLASAIERSGTAGYEATSRAYALLYRQLSVEAVALSHLDTLRILGIGAVCMLPMVFFLKRPGRLEAGLGH
jgi:DHA2 family multidrug resistance protein